MVGGLDGAGRTGGSSPSALAASAPAECPKQASQPPAWRQVSHRCRQQIPQCLWLRRPGSPPLPASVQLDLEAPSSPRAAGCSAVRVCMCVCTGVGVERTKHSEASTAHVPCAGCQVLHVNDRIASSHAVKQVLGRRGPGAQEGCATS